MLQTLGWRVLLLINVTCTGILLGLLQWGVFFMLQSYLASTAIVYLLGTSCWLLGSLLGLSLTGERGEGWWAAGMVLAYYAFRYIALTYPYNLAFLPLLLVMIAVMGGYAGRFFRYRARFFPVPKWLFFLENCGFVIGMVFTIVALFYLGATVLVSAPLLVSACMLASAASLHFYPTPAIVPVRGHPRAQSTTPARGPGQKPGAREDLRGPGNAPPGDATGAP